MLKSNRDKKKYVGVVLGEKETIMIPSKPLIYNRNNKTNVFSFYIIKICLYYSIESFELFSYEIYAFKLIASEDQYEFLLFSILNTSF
jgi:hypothetical protein